MLDTVQPRSQPQAGVQPNHLADEFVETLRLAVPMMLTQLGQIAMITTDLALIGRLGEDAVAAAAVEGWLRTPARPAASSSPTISLPSPSTSLYPSSLESRP